MDLASAEALALYQRIRQRQAELPGLIAISRSLALMASGSLMSGHMRLPSPRTDAAPALIELQAAADESAPIHQPPSRAMSWRGDVAQAKFGGKAMAMKLVVAILLTDCLPFDNIIVAPKRMYRVQVKSTGFSYAASWLLNLARSGGQTAYRLGDFDVLAAVTPEDVWYLIPHKMIVGRRKLSLPQRERLPHGGPVALLDLEKYREAWHVFQ